MAKVSLRMLISIPSLHPYGHCLESGPLLGLSSLNTRRDVDEFTVPPRSEPCRSVSFSFISTVSWRISNTPSFGNNNTSAVGWHMTTYRSHRCQSDRLAGGQGHQTDRTPAIFAGFGAGRLLPLPQGQEGAGRPHPDPGHLQEGVGGCRQEYYGGGLRQAFWRWFLHHEKCVSIGSGYLEKSWK